MIKKLFIIFCLFLFSFALADEPIKAKVKYKEKSARIEAFKDVKKKIDKDFYKDYLKDKNKKENLEAISKKNFELDNRLLCPFYIKSILLAYGITYFDKIDTTFYYNPMGNLIKFEISDINAPYPKKTYGYSQYGNLISVSFEVDEKEQYIYNKNGKLIAHWQDDKMQNKDDKIPKILQLKRGG